MSFSAERLRKTSSSMRCLLVGAGIAESAVRRIEDLASAEAARVDEKTAWVILSITQMLREGAAGEGVARPASPLRALLIDAYTNIPSVTVDFEGENLRSNSAWDEYVRWLTPHLPTFLSDYVSMVILKQGAFEAFWNVVCAGTSPEQRREILSWFRVEGQLFAGEDFLPPARLSE